MDATHSVTPDPAASHPSRAAEGSGDIRHGVVRLLDLSCGVAVVVGTGTISVRDCLLLAPGRVLMLDQTAGEDLQILANGVALARGEVMIDEETTHIRVTDVAPMAGADG